MKSPDKINEWISKKTFKMIPNAISEINPDVVLGIANAIAIDVEWKNKLECKDTYGKDFTKENGETYRASTMHGGNDVAYIENDNAKGIIKDYAIYDKNTGKIVEKESDNTIALEYIAILPNTSIDEYINNFSKDELNSLLKNQTVSDDNTHIYYSLPKYSYDFNYLSIKSALKELGLNDIFTGNNRSGL